MGERRTDQAGGVELGHAVGARAGERRRGFEVGEHVGNRGVVGGFDGLGELQRGQRPQCADGFDGGEGQVVTGDGGGAGAGRAGDVARQFAIIGGSAAVFGEESFARQVGADRRAGVLVDRGVPVPPGFGVVVAVGHRQGALKPRLAAPDVKGAAKLCAVERDASGHAAHGQIVGDGFGVGVQSFPKQGGHLCFADV